MSRAEHGGQWPRHYGHEHQGVLSAVGPVPYPLRAPLIITQGKTGTVHLVV